jgi:nucleolar protein 12
VVKPPSPKSRVLEKKDKDFAESGNEEEDAYEDKEPSEVEDEDEDMSADQTSFQQDDAQSAVGATATERSRKRKRKAAEEELEDTYVKKLQEIDERFKPKKTRKTVGSSRGGKEERSDSEDEGPKDSRKPVKHETLVPATTTTDLELDKSARTIFLGNVPSNAISSKTDYKALKKFFSTPGKIASVRFRSVAFSEQIPRKAAFVNHKLHEKQKTVNVYIVYKDIAGVREALKLNGSVVLDRHIRVDSVAHPGKQDNKRCVFVGNLDFETQEEKLWKHFGGCGKVDYVRVVRDAKTNVGKGFAYVQFEVAVHPTSTVQRSSTFSQNRRM